MCMFIYFKLSVFAVYCSFNLMLSFISNLLLSASSISNLILGIASCISKPVLVLASYQALHLASTHLASWQFPHSPGLSASPALTWSFSKPHTCLPPRQSPRTRLSPRQSPRTHLSPRPAPPHTQVVSYYASPIDQSL